MTRTGIAFKAHIRVDRCTCLTGPRLGRQATHFARLRATVDESAPTARPGFDHLNVFYLNLFSLTVIPTPSKETALPRCLSFNLPRGFDWWLFLRTEELGGGPGDVLIYFGELFRREINIHLIAIE